MPVYIWNNLLGFPMQIQVKRETYSLMNNNHYIPWHSRSIRTV